MSALVSPQRMEETWRAAAVMSPNSARLRQERCGKEQPELTGFVIGFTADLPPDAVGLALYVYVVAEKRASRAPCGLDLSHNWSYREIPSPPAPLPKGEGKFEMHTR